MTSLTAISMSQRYARAGRMTAPRVAAGTPGIAVEGYWLDGSSFYFLAERFDSALGGLVGIPSIATVETNSVQELIPAEILVHLICEASGKPVEPTVLAAAEFDMPDRDTLGVTVAGRACLIDWRRRKIVETKAAMDVPALYSPDGRHACFVMGCNLWLKESSSGTERALTAEGDIRFRYGQQPETCLSTVTYRQHPYPVGLWSADSQWFLTHRIDERTLPELALLQNVPRGGGRCVLHSYKYPMPGDPLAMTTYVAIHIASGRVVAFDDFAAPVLAYSPFFQRMAWFSGADVGWIVRMDRYRKKAELIRLELARGEASVVIRETVESGYLDLQPIAGATPNIRTLARSDEIIWFSERDGWGHLYLYDATTGRLKNQITRGEWLVRDIVHVDEERRTVLFLAGGVDAKADPACRSLCSVDLDGRGFRVLLSHRGDIHVPGADSYGWEQDRAFRPASARAGISPDGRWVVVRYASVERGNRTEIVELQAGKVLPLAAARPSSDEVLPRHFEATAADGATRLRGVMFLPSDFDESKRYPLVDYIYPGPQVPWQPQSFGSLNSSFARALAELGFVTFMLDTRGMPIRSRAFHQAGYGALLEPQLADHAAVVRQLCANYSFVDAERVGMIGWSGGGAATVRALCDYGGIFKVGVAACGNHDSSFYSTSWSDKYRGPGTAADWAGQSNIAVAHKLAGKLLLISGDMDENVHVSQTFALVDALVRANRDFELLIVPNEGHSVLMTNGYAQRRAWDFLVRQLLGETPPPGFEMKFAAGELAHFMKSSKREMRQ